MVLGYFARNTRELVPSRLVDPLQSIRIDMIGVEGALQAREILSACQLHSAGQAKARYLLAAHRLGEGSLALGITARVEALHGPGSGAAATKFAAGSAALKRSLTEDPFRTPSIPAQAAS